jgi:hypothetical protein
MGPAASMGPLSERRSLVMSTSNSDALLRELGRVTVAFGRVESYLSFAVGGLIGPDQAIGQMVTAEMSFKNKLALFSSLVMHKLPFTTKNTTGCKEHLKELLTVLSTAEEERNQVAHSIWLMAAEAESPDPAIRLKITAKQSKGLRHASHPTTADDLKAIADKLNGAAEAIVPFLVRCLREQGAEP